MLQNQAGFVAVMAIIMKDKECFDAWKNIAGTPYTEWTIK